MTMKRAYSTLTIKAVDDETRTITGIATTAATDRVGDIVEPKGAEFKLPLPFLWQHRHSEPIGQVTKARVTKEGIEVTVQLAKVDEPGTLKDRLDEAWQSIKAGLVRGLSIGFQSVESARIEGTYGIRFLKWMWLELSAVTIPANAEASIQTIKSIDTEVRAASGTAHRGVVRLDNPPGASGNTTKTKPQEGNMNVQDQIKAFEAKRAEKAARMNAIMAKSSEAGETLDIEEEAEYDGLKAEIATIDKHLERLREHEKSIAVSTKTTVVKGASQQEAAESRSPGAPTIIVSKDVDERFKGQNYTRMVIAKALARVLDESPLSIAQKRWGRSNPTLVNLIKAAVAGGGSGSGEWGAELVQADARYTGDFIEFLYSKTVFDKLPLREVPANVAIKGQDGQATGYWVGQSKGIPATTVDFSTVNLTPLKVAALAVVSNELLRDSTPAAEMLVRDALVNASAQRVDTTFLSTAAAVAGVSPAGLLNGVSAIGSAGTDGTGLRTDVKALYAAFIAAKNASDLWFVMNPSLAKAIQLMTNALGLTEFPGISTGGGQLLGDNVATGDNVNAAHLILLKPSDIWRIGDMGIEVSISREAMIEQDTAPTGATDTPVAASAYMTSMFQEESTAIKVVRPINFQKRRASAVQYINDADYGAEAT